MKIGVQGPFSVYSGYGNDTVSIAMALKKRGHEVFPVPTLVETGLPPAMAQMFTIPLPRQLDALLINAAPNELRPKKGLELATNMIVGWSMWEQTKLDPGFMKGSGRWPFRHLNCLLAYDPVSKKAFEDADPGVRVSLLQGGVDAEFWPYHPKDWSGRFRFGMLGALHGRKNPWCSIEAFTELQADGELEDAELVLKTNVPGLHPRIAERFPNVTVITDVWSRQQIKEFVQSIHVLLAPSVGEGKNLPALEAQLSGAVCLATGWGGHAVWQHPSYSPAIEYDLVPVEAGSPSMVAQPRKEHLKTLMVDMYKDRRKAKELGRIASGAIRSQCDWSTVVQKLERYLGRGNG